MEILASKRKRLSAKGLYSNTTVPILALVDTGKVDSLKTTFVCGKINTVGYDREKRRLWLIPVNGATIDDASVRTYLQKTYNPAIVEWQVGYDPVQQKLTLTDTELANLCKGIDVTLFTNYTEGQIAALTKYATEPEDKTYLLFLVKGTAGDAKGFMPLNRSAGFIYTDGQTAGQINRTIAHELGHGAFGLDHVGKAAGKEATDNLMDYAGGTALDKPQWDKMHSEYRRLKWFQDASEGMWTTDGHYYTVQLVALMMGMPESAAMRYGKASEEPDTHIVTDGNAQEKDTWLQSKLQQRYHALTGGYHGVELAVTAYAFTRSHQIDEASFNYLLHRFGDCFAHYELEFDTTPLTGNIDLKLYIAAIDSYVSDTFSFSATENSKKKIYTTKSSITVTRDLIDFLLVGTHTTAGVTISQSDFYGISLSDVQEAILLRLPTANQNKFVMYGATNQIGCMTWGHAFRDNTADGKEYSPDNILKRSQLYLLYVDALEQLIAIKEGRALSPNTQQSIALKLSTIIDYLKETSVTRLDGILNFEIAKLRDTNLAKIVFQIPVKYVVEDNLSVQGVAYSNSKKLFNPDADAKKILSDTYDYFSISKITDSYTINVQPYYFDGVQFWEFELIKK